MLVVTMCLRAPLCPDGTLYPDTTACPDPVAYRDAAVCPDATAGAGRQDRRGRLSGFWADF